MQLTNQEEAFDFASVSLKCIHANRFDFYVMTKLSFDIQRMLYGMPILGEFSLQQASLLLSFAIVLMGYF